MLHEDAIRTHAAERYLLGDMSPAERETYEEHYFSCDICGDELAATAAFVDNARAVGFRPRPVGEPTERADVGPWWARLFASPPPGLVPAMGLAVVVLMAAVSYQGLTVIPELRQQLAGRDRPQEVPTLALRSASRGAGPRLVVSDSQPYVVLQADMLADRGVTSYTAVLRTDSGDERMRTVVAAPEPGLPVTILVPSRDLAAGDYALLFYEGDAAGLEAGRFTFTIERQ